MPFHNDREIGVVAHHFAPTRARRSTRSTPSSTRRVRRPPARPEVDPVQGCAGARRAADLCAMCAEAGGRRCDTRRGRASVSGRLLRAGTARGGDRPRPRPPPAARADAASGAPRLVLAAQRTKRKIPNPATPATTREIAARPADRDVRRRRCRARTRPPTAATAVLWDMAGARSLDTARDSRQTARRRTGGCVPERAQKKFTEPVALSSPEPVGFPLPRTAPRLGFDLLALRARCKRELSRPGEALQECSRKRRAQFAPSSRKPERTSTLSSTLERVGTMDSPSRWRFRPPSRLAFRFRVRPLGSASTYSRSVLGAGANLLRRPRRFKPSTPRKARSLRARRAGRRMARKGTPEPSAIHVAT